MKEIFLEYYRTSRGDCPVAEYIADIDDIDEAASIVHMLDQVDQLGSVYLLSGDVSTRKLSNGLYDIKYSKHRIYYMYFDNNKVYLLHACYKQKNKAEKKDLEIGIKRMKEVLNRTR